MDFLGLNCPDWTFNSKVFRANCSPYENYCESMGLGMAVVTSDGDQKRLVSFLEQFTDETTRGETPYYIGLSRQQGQIPKLTLREHRADLWIPIFFSR